MRRSPGGGRRRVALRAARSALLPGLLAALVLAAPAAAPGAEIDDFVGRPVVAVELHSGGSPLRDEGALALVETEVGAPLSMRQVRESVTHLFSLGRFASGDV